MKLADTGIELETRTEILRVAKRLAPCIDTLGPISFLGDPASAEQRRQWFDSVWHPIVSVSLQKARNLCRHGYKKIITIDLELDSRLAGPLAKSSRAAGRRLASISTAPVGETAFATYLESVKRDQSPGHFAIVFGVRAGLFQIPPHITRAAFLLLEMRAARPADLWPAIEEGLATPGGSRENFLAA